ncbi:MAG: acyltransferase [Chloroflexota bacterium]|nr:acyltransferase [Chloroflexota bacterium]
MVFGDNVVLLDTATPWTYSREARIVIGDNVTMGATQFGCMREIVIGRDCILARASIMDTDFHSTRADRRSDGAPVRVAPVHVGDNVWIGQSAGILPGTRIGKNSVVSFGAVCMREYPENVIIMGNPAKVAMPIPSGGAQAVTSEAMVVGPGTSPTLGAAARALPVNQGTR